MSADPNSILLSVPFGEELQSISSPRYYWNNSRRGKVFFVILQWTLEGEGCFEFKGEKRTVGEGEAFIAIPPEESAYYFPGNARRAWKFGWVNFYGPLAVSLFRQLREVFGPVLPLHNQSAAGIMARRLIDLARGGDYFRSARGQRGLLCLPDGMDAAADPSDVSAGGSGPGCNRVMRGQVSGTTGCEGTRGANRLEPRAFYKIVHGRDRKITCTIPARVAC